MTKQILADQAADRLAEAMELIRNPQGWCQGGIGKDKDGRYADPWGKDCVQRCALGSLIAASRGREDAVFSLALNTLDWAARSQHDGKRLITVNDVGQREKAHPRVIALFPPAIDHLRSLKAPRKPEPWIPHPAAVWSAAMQANCASF